MTQCCIVELYKMGKERQPAVDLAKTFERRMCNHREAIEGEECLMSVVGTRTRAIMIPFTHLIAHEQGTKTNIVM
jgi:rRNA-processing protein FCF1